MSAPPVEDLLAYLDASPTPYHAAAEAARRLEAAGSVRVSGAERWSDPPARGHLLADGALIAWSLPPGPAAPPLRLIGAHTDSPGLRIKPQPDTGAAGWRQLGVEVYGGALVNSWLDRDLGLAGRVAVTADDGAVSTRLVRDDTPLLRVPQLAIHLDREITSQGLRLDRQRHLTPVWDTGMADPDGFRRHVGRLLDVAPDRVRGWDVMVHDVTPARLVGLDGAFVSSGRLDDLVSCWAGLVAMAARAEVADGEPGAVLALFDHEEVGSTSTRGAGGPLLAEVLERLVAARGGDRSDLLAALTASASASADMAHATHPNHAEKHEPRHPIAIDGGPVVKINANQRYATEAATQAAFELACDRAGVPVQRFVGHNEVPCGSTIGPISAAGLGIATVDVGVAQLAMHSARELCGSLDPGRFALALGEWLQG